MTARACLLAVATIGLFTFVVADWDAIAGYTPVSDVVEHSELDLDMLDMEVGADNQTETGFLDAWKAYSEGGNSEKTDSIRTIRGFSTSAQEKMSAEPWFKIYKDYWGEPDYADLYTAAACNGTDSFAGLDPIIRAEGCVKGAQYQNVWMYVIHELEDAISDCLNGDLTANNGGPHAWDEGWAFYAGSQEDGSGSGVMPYALAEKRCAQFGTCTGDDDGSSVSGTSYVNMMLLDLYHDGQEKLLNGECAEVDTIKEEIVRLMTIPLMQGLLRYVYLSTTGGDKEAAELWAFSAALLPQIDNCSQDVATTIRSNTDITSSDAPISEGYVTIKQKLESVYSCMNIACSEVGGLLSSAGTYLSGMEPCTDTSSSTNSNTDSNTDSSSETDGDNDNDNGEGYTPRTVNDDEGESDSGSDLEGWAIAVIVLVVLAVLGVAVYFYLQRRRNRSVSSNFASFGGDNATA